MQQVYEVKVSSYADHLSLSSTLGRREHLPRACFTGETNAGAAWSMAVKMSSTLNNIICS